MTDKKDPSQDADSQSGTERPTLSRRTFLKASAVSAGALALPALAACKPSRSVEPAPTTGNTPPRAADDVAPASGQPANPDQGSEKWFEPWEWRVGDHGSDDFLQLNVVEHQASELVTGGQPVPLFSYNGVAPGPTIRMRGDEILRLHLVNQLSGNNGKYANKSEARWVNAGKNPDGTNHEANTPVGDFPDWQLSDLVYGPHQQHTTNIHTHGLHVSPQTNDDGSYSDNVLLRLIPQEDFVNRQSTKINWPLTPHREIRKEARYEFRLGKSSGPDIETHPPGTHWYHPHPHGATYDQVASGMASFVIVEGDVDDMLKEQIKGYKERLMFFQRVVAPPVQESEANAKVSQSQNRPAFPSVNGRAAGQLVMVMQPGAIERWRILNGSVDGQGYIELVVVVGEPPAVPPKPAPPPKNATADQNAEFEQENKAYQAALQAQIDYLTNETNQVTLDQLAFDGITLVNNEGIYDTMRVNSLILAPANRADFLFQAPTDQPSASYTLWAKWVPEVSDRTNPPDPANAKIATIVVQGPQFDPGVTRNAQGKLGLRFPEVPALIQPIGDDEITIEDGSDQGKWRTRRVIYSGWGAANYPCSSKVNSMLIDGQKFDSAVPAHTMALGTAEEWTLDNYSMTIYEDKDGKLVYGETVSHETLGDNVRSKAVDHPFHIHQNPFRVLSITDANGQELLPGGQHRWQDVVRIPRNGGRVIFRSRFWDYPGEFVNHCHLLQHEDWGMMQVVQVQTHDKHEPDYVPNPKGFQWPKATKKEMYGLGLGTSSLLTTCDDPDPGPPPD